MTKYFAGAILLTVSFLAIGLYLKHTPAPEAQSAADATASPQAINPRYAQEQRLAQLEAELETLKNRIAQIESKTPEPLPVFQSGSNIENDVIKDTLDESRVVETRLDGLVAAGLEPYRAEEIIREQSRVELKRLELRDAAIREGYLGTEKFRQEMRALRANETGIRSEVGEEVFDRFLFHTGQPNRLQVESVILGSAAENAGMQTGDIILSYQDKRLLSWNDLRGVTSAGERGESVNLVIQRDGSTQTLTLPRGPMGVRINAVRIDPGSG